MKAKSSQLNALTNQIKTSFKGALIYGANEPIVAEISRKIAQLITPNLQDDFCVKKLTAADIKENPTILADEMNALSLMGGRRLIWVSNPTDSQIESVESAISGCKTDSFLLISAGTLTARSALRTYSENAPEVLTIPCYEETDQDIKQLIVEKLSSAGYKMTPDAMQSLCDLTGKNRSIVKSELEKIILYQGDNKTITDDIVQKVVDNGTSYSMDELCIAIGNGNQNRVSALYQGLLSEGETPVSIVRVVMGYFNKLLLAADMLVHHKSMDEIFRKILYTSQFKLQDPIEKQLSFWSKQKLIPVVLSLLELEKKTKTTDMPAELLVFRMLNSIAGRVKH